MTLADKILKGDVGAAAQLISAIEDGSNSTLVELERLCSCGSNTHVIGVTGPPGVGKSTLVGCLISVFREKDLAVGVIATDPSSPFTHGAILGDRIRMQLQHDEGVFVRSVAAHGGDGGLAEVTPAVIQVMKALGRDIIMLETVGIGQAEIDITALSDSCVLVLNPGSGDDIQMLKAGILEAADILVVNKADSGGADDLKRGLEFMLNTRTYRQGSFKPPIVLTEALYNDGIPELATAILMHREFLAQKAGQSLSTVKGRR